MSTHARICTVLFSGLPFTAVWEVAIHIPADGSPPAELVAAGAAPQVIAVLLALGILANSAKAKPERKESSPAVYEYLPPAPRREVTARVARKELAR